MFFVNKKSIEPYKLIDFPKTTLNMLKYYLLQGTTPGVY